MKYKVDITDEYDRLVKFFVENELEFDADEEVDTDIVQCYKIENPKVNNSGAAKDEYVPGSLIGAAVLAMREGEYIVDGIAVNPDFRKKGIGKLLLDKISDDVVEMDGESLFLVARTPEFFRRYGFVSVNPDEAPNFFECKYCPQYMVSCYPDIMKYDL